MLAASDGSSAERLSSLSNSPRVDELQAVIKSLSTTSSSNPLLSSWRISTLLEQANISEQPLEAQEETAANDFTSELEWLLLSKVTVQTYGLILNTLLEETIPLSDDIWYWDEVLGSYAYTGLYTVQTSPLRFWDWTKDIYDDTRRKLANLHSAEEISARKIGANLTGQWKQFYGLVQESIRDRSVADIQRRVLSPLALSRTEARRKQKHLKRLREMGASGLGVLMDEGLDFDMDDEEGAAKSQSADAHEWKDVVERSVALMDTILSNVTALDNRVSEFEDTVFASVEDDPEISATFSSSTKTARLSKRLQQILQQRIPAHASASRNLASQYGRPPRLVRYWLPATALLLSSTTILRIVVNRQAEIVQWVQDFGATLRDFWMNWVIEPTKKIIGTIRHDKDSELAIMSKESLKGDRDSLERMVIDFAVDKPEASDMGSEALTEAQIEQIRAKVREGDLTPVLRAYEKALRSPVRGAVTGGLVRSLLIQVQKTKVDVEVALNGIDSLLKSQELVFGFVGLTPGILVCVGAFRYLGDIFGNRRGLKKGQKAGQTIRVLRNIDRVLTKSRPSSSGMLTYKDHGLLLCEVHVLRRRAQKLFPGEIEREFLEDVNELADIRIGVERQLKVVERIRWAYGRWLR